MKRPSPSFFAVLCTLAAAIAPAYAADLTLSDGRVFHDASVVSQSPRNVVIRHAGGLSGVQKTLLPADLAARYPVDEAAAREADVKAAQARAQATAFHQAEAERAARLRSEREQSALLNAQIAAQEASARLAQAEAERLENQRTETVYTYTPWRPDNRYIYSPRRSREHERRWTDSLCDNQSARDDSSRRPEQSTRFNKPIPPSPHANPAHRELHNPCPAPSSGKPDSDDKKLPQVAAAVVRR